MTRETFWPMLRDLLRLIFSFHGRHAELDQRLRRLASVIRGGADDSDLRPLIDGIVDMIVAEDLAQSAAARSGGPPAASRGHGADPATTEITTLRRELDRPRDAQGSMPLLESAQLVTALLEPDRPADALAVLLRNLTVPAAFERTLATLREQALEQTDRRGALLCAEAAAAALSELLAAPTAPADETVLLSYGRSLLLSLLERFPAPGDLSPDVRCLRASVESAGDAEALEGCARTFAEVIAATRNRLQAELDGLARFLKTVTRRLQDVVAAIQRSSSSHDETVGNAARLSRSMHQAIFGIRDEIQDHGDVASLKAAINRHLDTIDRGLSEFAEDERHRHVEARSAAEGMLTKLRELENEARRLRADVEEQHARALIDPLTHLLNRAGYEEHVAKAYARWRRYGGDLSLVVLDVDHFKQINDAYGHTAGDNVLINVAGLLVGRVRKADILCRYGGEEFLMILPETGVDDARGIAEKIRRYLEKDCRFHFHDEPVAVTVSCGIAGFQPGDTPEQVFERADHAMYLAKRRGRNQCCGEHELPPDRCDPGPLAVSSSPAGNSAPRRRPPASSS